MIKLKTWVSSWFKIKKVATCGRHSVLPLRGRSTSFSVDFALQCWRCYNLKPLPASGRGLSHDSLMDGCLSVSRQSRYIPWSRHEVAWPYFSRIHSERARARDDKELSSARASRMDFLAEREEPKQQSWPRPFCRREARRGFASGRRDTAGHRIWIVVCSRISCYVGTVWEQD